MSSFWSQILFFFIPHVDVFFIPRLQLFQTFFIPSHGISRGFPMWIAPKKLADPPGADLKAPLNAAAFLGRGREVGRLGRWENHRTPHILWWNPWENHVFFCLEKPGLPVACPIKIKKSKSGNFEQRGQMHDESGWWTVRGNIVFPRTQHEVFFWCSMKNRDWTINIHKHISTHRRSYDNTP